MRTAAQDDAVTVGQLLHAFNTEFDSPTPTALLLGERFRRLLTLPDVLVVLAEDEAGDATGFAFLTVRPTPYYDGPLAQLEELYVRPGRRDRGIGTALLAEAVDGVRLRGAGEMHIDVDEVDVDTRRFYERHGFLNIEPGEDYRMLCYIREF
ncbi:GNAT family N-acetyltransferase [Arthrobacter sp. B0490]|uniref:GNAT family N-acetyltransferase n=1 Tax=Arthrobacter sp. B0490 TaxID=2058891 RepID=UPI00215857A0|nr:GNAT family N-acetyltransferase [Arthrobacter sp. B0490]